ncbi:MAG TPA: NADH-quinone oxidoreductase subunit L [Candidatus Angelobacter sp.]|nr:NADH-quinone oxidoreductase subunit L [Candidatus Angelobacter sp.]
MSPDINLNLWIIPILPLIGAAINGFFGRRFKNGMVSFVTLLFTAASFGYALWAATQVWHGWSVNPSAVYDKALPFNWIVAGDFTAPFGFYLDQLSMVMMLVVTGVGFLIHIYSVGYMAHEGGYYRFFAYLNLFMFFMLTLVLANNYLLMFVGWEGVGLASYLLIGFYFNKDSAANAGKKAFIVNRIGDFAFLLGMFLLIQHFHSLNFSAVFDQVSKLGIDNGWGLLTAIALLLMIGATGKSAQIPLYVWLPDAMEGPTPVSALIHAATMVTAGIYMITRSSAIFSRSPHALMIVAIIGAVTALFAATMGLAQTDIKRVLAYSTVSQLGYMFMACGVAAFSAGIFHLMTHAFFKALLFLGAGSVIHAVGGEQDMRRMGGLRKLTPWTFGVMGIATLAISGIFPLSGFFSKDEILWQAFSSKHGHPILWLIGLITAGMTSFYMFRLFFMTFFGDLRLGNSTGEHAHAAAVSSHHSSTGSHSHDHADDHGHGHGGVHESPWVMLAPLVVLAVLSVVGGWVGIPKAMHGGDNFKEFLSPAIKIAQEIPGTTVAGAESSESGGQELLFAAISIVVALTGIFLAWLLYLKRPELPGRITARVRGLYTLVLNKYYVDESYGALFVKPLLAISTYVLWKGVDQGVIDGTVNGAGSISKGIGGGMRKMQSGNIRSYAAWIAIGGTFAVAYMLWKAVQ